MATRQDLLDAFESRLNGFILPASGRNQNWVVAPDGKSAITGTETSIDQSHTLEMHILYYWDQDRILTGNQSFYVLDPGTPGEGAAWIRGNDPKPVPVLTFREEMLAWVYPRMDTQVGPYTLRVVESSSSDETQRRGVVNLIAENADGDLVRVSTAVWKDAQDAWQFQPIA